MASSLGSLVVSLGLDSAEFTRGMTKSQYEAQKAMGRIKQEAADMGKIIGIAAVAAGAAAIKMGADFINAAADLDDLAEKTGASVEELSKLAQQARISGTDLGTVEMGLVRLAKSLNATDEESKKATKALDFLGLKAADLAKMDTAQALKLVATEMNRFGDGSGKTALALDLFGRSGAQLLPFLKDMANDGELAATVTAKQAAEAEELGKSYRRLTNDARNVGQALALELVPWLQSTIDELVKGTQAAGGFWKALLVGGTINPFRSLHDNLVAYRKELKDLEGGGYGETRMAQLRRAQVEMLERQQRSAALALGGADTRGEIQRFGLAGAKLPANYRSEAVGDDKAAKKARDETERDRKAQLDALRRANDADLRAFQDYKEQIKKIGDEIKERRYYENIFGADAEGLSTADLKTKLESMLQGVDALTDSYDNAARAAAGFDENGKVIAETLKKNDDVAKSLGLTFSSAFEDAIIGGKKFRDVLGGIAQDIARLFIRKQVTEPLVNLIGNINFGSFFSGGGSGGAAPASAPYFGPAATGIERVPQDGFAFLHKGETVVPEYASRGGGVTISQSIHVGGNVSQADIPSILSAARRGAIEGVAEAASRDPSYRRLLQGA